MITKILRAIVEGRLLGTTFKATGKFFTKLRKLFDHFISLPFIYLLSRFTKVDEKKIQKELEKVLPENLKFVSTIESKEVEKLYGLDEAIFMDNAVELDPKTRKPLKTEAPKEDPPKTENK